VTYIPPSRSILAWRVLHDKLSTDAALCTRGFIFPSCCRLCSAAEEDLCHFFLECPFVRGLWEAMSFAFRHRLYLDELVDLRREAMQISFSTQFQSLWQAE